MPYNKAILFAILNLGSAKNPHVPSVRSGFCALAASKLPATMTLIVVFLRFFSVMRVSS
ncbi:L-asparaginase [Yersinia kristensenii]|nr:L-asparaginase [Yersinia enterocolitica]PEH54625.1 L-asparaginase [Yersinia kristensenii]EKN6254746.1 L-asparaginase [Yersinia enterocolitica]PHZ36180.1 L-asparaginase [Yersinia kristensenii]PJE82574.1 L-asparaginase [Yersinia kristensenii]